MAKKINHDAATDLSRYNPSLGRHALVEPTTWKRIRPVVIEAVRTETDLSANSLRPFLTAMTKLAAWAETLGYEMTVETLLTPAMINAFLARQEFGTGDVATKLWRLSIGWKLTSPESRHLGQVSRRDLHEPYGEVELAALVRFARTQPTQHRRTTLLAIVSLGAGCGLTREAVHDVSASDLHHHGDSLFVRSVGHCAWVRPEFAGMLGEVARVRPDGPLRGRTDVKNLVAKASGWIDHRHGVPALSTDRLRATYVCHLLISGISATDILEFTGLKHLDSLDAYLAFIDLAPSSCPQRSAVAS